MFRSRLLWRLYAGYVVLIVATTAILGIHVAWRLQNDSLADTELVLRAKTAFLADMLVNAPAGGASLEDRVRELGKASDARLTIIRADGGVLADSDEDPARMENHADRPEIMAAREKGSGVSTRWSHTLKVDMMYAAAAVRRGNRLYGFARAALPLTSISRRLAHLRFLVVIGAVSASIAGILLGFLFVRSVTRPLTALTESAEAIASGNLDQKIWTEAPGEVGKLARAFRLMTDRLKERMEAVTRGRNQLAAILGGMVEGVVAVDPEGRILHMNEVAGSMLGTRPAESLGKVLWEVTRLPAVMDILSRKPAEMSVTTLELRLPGEKGERIYEVRVSPFRDREDGSGGLVIVLHEVTDLRRLEQVRRDFVANVSHELKTPVTAIRGLAETMMDDEAMDQPTHRQFLGRVRDQAVRLGRLVGDLLTISRVESGGGVLEKDPVDLREPVRDSVRAFQPAAEAKGLALSSDLPEGPVTVLGDREALRQVVDNLLDNAVKFTPSGGRVTVRLKAGNDAMLEVADTGPGIGPEHLGRLFERFYRVDKARSRELGGTGLGLSIVKHVALALGGGASVESTPGAGSTFRVRLPRA